MAIFGDAAFSYNTLTTVMRVATGRRWWTRALLAQAKSEYPNPELLSPTSMAKIYSSGK